ncbi:WGR domain-containing protein [Pseudorhodobacter turbinis]|uniref:WGR domain-containing protein n=1 Tax=Pseudorhodobacter turbinis TaxID=2500533 RepID=A0A4P8EG47_9RHOB|nr:WGR domain-containing protein [Pseudorhodobacter turbinis]QCO56111.1 WGR domain-containing protein [Pseudorhodobacter turbinis]
MLRNRKGHARYYRVDVAYNLFGEYSVLREWGLPGKPGASSGNRKITWFSNLREACLAAEHLQSRASRRGYAQTLADQGGLQ